MNPRKNHQKAAKKQHQWKWCCENLAILWFLCVFSGLCTVLRRVHCRYCQMRNAASSAWMAQDTGTTTKKER